MATLNYNWQNLNSVALTNNITIYLDGKLTSQSTLDNTSTIQLRFRSGGYKWRTTSGTVEFTGEFTDSGGCATYPTYIEDGDTFFTITKTITHGSTGDKSFNIGGYISVYIDGGRKNKTIDEVSVTLPHIDRYATMTNSINFNDEQNPSFTFSNPGGFRINARLEFGGTSISRDNIANTGSYTFELTTSERNTLRQYCTGQSMTIRYVIATCLSGTTESGWSYQDRTMTIVNGNPTFNVTYEDSNSTTTAITNNNQQIIQNNSTLQFNITNATALKYATLSTVSVTINGSTQTEAISSSSLAFSYGVVNVANDTNASVVLTDSRGLTTTISVPITILSWSLPNAIITLNRKSNYYTETDIKVDANYSSLDSKNTITIQYRTKKTSSSTWGSWNSLSDNVTATFNADNQYTWDVQVKLTDRLGNTTYNLGLGVGIPIMFVDRSKRNVGIDCFPNSTNALEVQGNQQINGNLVVADSSGNNGVNILNELNTINSSFITETTTYLPATQSTSNQTLWYKDLNVGIYLFVCNLEINYYGANGRELYTYLYLGNDVIDITLGVINTSAYTLSRPIIKIVNVTSDNSRLRLDVKSSTTANYIVASSPVQLLRLK